ncbi:hypothetical protein H072_1021 [Dactylellina haptotyla CBS 200.50]|uniref:B30.2/SPRY domain-containing protein n=1 Tax=Dactylellina haptotyla (strain CBS 200.50) TaxID=1284197 RepID=S8AVG7_DACHA|nr:hypothetical protein H072_1021 [Dactylellina haptotyla CBS 200.50]
MLIRKLDAKEVNHFINQTDSDKGFNPLHLATMFGNIEMVEFLLDLKLDPAIKTNKGDRAEDIAIHRISALCTIRESELSRLERQELCLIKLMTGGFESKLDPQTVLHKAIRCKSAGLLELASRLGNPDLGLPDEDGWTAYHVALQADATAFLRKSFPDHPHDKIYSSLPPTCRPSRFSRTRKGLLCETTEDGLEVRHRAVLHIDKVVVPTEGKAAHGLPGRYLVDETTNNLNTNGWRVSSAGKEDQLILADFPIPAEDERYYFEITVDKKKLKEEAKCSIGIQTSRTSKYNIDKISLFGSTLYSYFGDVEASGKVLSYRRTNYGTLDRSFGTEGKVDTVGCGFDTQKGYPFFTLNGEYLGVATRVLTNTKYFPAVTLDQNCRLKVNFGQRPFIFDRAFESIDALGR